MNLDSLIIKAIDNLGFDLIEMTDFGYLVKPKNYDSAIAINLFYNFTNKDIKRISSSKNSYKIVEKETKKLLKESFDPIRYYQGIFDDETDYYMKNNGYFLALRLNMLDSYINNL